MSWVYDQLFVELWQESSRRKLDPTLASVCNDESGTLLHWLLQEFNHQFLKLVQLLLSLFWQSLSHWRLKDPALVWRKESACHESIIPVPNDDWLVGFRSVSSWVHYPVQWQPLHEFRAEGVSISVYLNLSCFFIFLLFLLALINLFLTVLWMKIIIFSKLWKGCCPPSILLLINLWESVRVRHLIGISYYSSFLPHDWDHLVIGCSVKDHFFLFTFLKIIVSATTVWSPLEFHIIVI